jgi:hypothetical protein
VRVVDNFMPFLHSLYFVSRDWEGLYHAWAFERGRHWSPREGPYRRDGDENEFTFIFLFSLHISALHYCSTICELFQVCTFEAALHLVDCWG